MRDRGGMGEGQGWDRDGMNGLEIGADGRGIYEWWGPGIEGGWLQGRGGWVRDRQSW